MSLEKPDAFPFRWPNLYQSNPTEFASETKPDYASSGEKLPCPLLAPQAGLAITKTRPKRDLTPLEVTAASKSKPDARPLRPDPVSVPDFPDPPIPPPPTPNVPLKPPRNPPRKPPNEATPRSPAEIVPPPQQMPPPPVPPDI